MNDRILNILGDLTGILGQANVAVPLIFATITGVAAIIRGVTGSGPSLPEVAAMLETKIDQNDAAGLAELARLRTLIGS